jgi:hypothetical protein
MNEDEIGQLSHVAEGRMSAQLMRRNQAPFSDDHRQNAAAEEKARAWTGYFGYLGPIHLLRMSVEWSTAAKEAGFATSQESNRRYISTLKVIA